MTTFIVNLNKTMTEYIIDTGLVLIIMREDITNINKFEISNYWQVLL